MWSETDVYALPPSASPLRCVWLTPAYRREAAPSSTTSAAIVSAVQRWHGLTDLDCRERLRLHPSLL